MSCCVSAIPESQICKTGDQYAPCTLRGMYRSHFKFKSVIIIIIIIIIISIIIITIIIIIVPTEIDECQYVGWRCDEYKGFYDRNRWAPFNWSDRKTKDTCQYGDLQKVKTKSISY